jgi:hypothetical protein
MTSTPQLDRDLHRLFFDREPLPSERLSPPQAGLDERAQQVYRRQVRSSIMGGVRLGIPITRRLLGEDPTDELIAAWLADAPPTTRLYWRLPMEFAAWLREQPDLPHPALADVVHWETIEIEVLNAADPTTSDLGSQPALDVHIALDPSARLGIYHFPVFRMEREASTWPDALDAPRFVIAFRRDECLHWRLLSAPLAQLLARTTGGESIGEGLEFLGELYEEFDPAPVITSLNQLVEEQVVMGFYMG